MNPVHRQVAYELRIKATLAQYEDDPPVVPNRRMIRDTIRQFADTPTRRACFGIWRKQWARA